MGLAVIDVGVTALQALQHLISKSLECLGCVSQAKRHSHKLEKVKGCYDRCLGNIGWFDRNLVVSTHQIYLRKDCEPILKISVQIVPHWLPAVEELLVVGLYLVVWLLLVEAVPTPGGRHLESSRLLLLLGHHPHCPT